MCEFLERAGLRGTPTEEVREWSTMTHRVVELFGPFPTPDDRRVELWLHEESATRLLDMCDRIDADFDRTKTENAKLRKICADMLRTMKHTTGPYIQTNHHTLLTKVFRDGKPTNVQASLTSLEERYEQLLREIGIEVRDD